MTPLIWEIRESPISFLSIARPYCNSHSLYRAELAVVAKAIEHLLTIFDSSQIRYEFSLAPSCRPDIACFRGTEAVLLFECKAGAVTMATVRQAQRYLAAASIRWPERSIQVWCVGTSLSPRLTEPPEGIVYAVISV